MNNNDLEGRINELTKTIAGLEERLVRLEQPGAAEKEAAKPSLWKKLLSKFQSNEELSPEERSQLDGFIVSFWDELSQLKKEMSSLAEKVQRMEEQNRGLQSQLDELKSGLDGMGKKTEEDRELLRSQQSAVQSLQGCVHSLVLNNVKERSSLGDDFLRMLRAFKVLQDDISKFLKTAVRREESRQWCNHALKCLLLNQPVQPCHNEDEEQARILLDKFQSFTKEHHVSELYSKYEGVDLEACLICPKEDDEYNHEMHESRGKLVADSSCDDSQYSIKSTLAMGLRVPADVSKTVKAIVIIKQKDEVIPN